MAILFCLQASTFSMVVLTMDRLFAIKLPLRYSNKSRVRSYCMSVFDFIMAAVVLLTQIIYDKTSPKLLIQAYGLVAMVLFNIIVVSIANTFPSIETKKHIHRIFRQEQAASKISSISQSNVSIQQSLKSDMKNNNNIQIRLNDISLLDEATHVSKSVLSKLLGNDDKDPVNNRS